MRCPHFAKRRRLSFVVRTPFPWRLLLVVTRSRVVLLRFIVGRRRIIPGRRRRLLVGITIWFSVVEVVPWVVMWLRRSRFTKKERVPVVTILL